MRTEEPAESGVALRVATWNMNHWRQPTLPTDTRSDAWARMHSMGVHVALAQEAVPPPDLGAGRAVYAEIGGHRHWGSAVVALDPRIEIEPIRTVRLPFSRRHYVLEHGRDGMSIARITIPRIEPIVFVSLYAIWDGPVVGNVLRAAANLLPLFDSPDGSRVIVGGDLNVGTATTDPRHLARGNAALDAIRSLGLVDVKSVVASPPGSTADCPCKQPDACTHLPTWGTAEIDHLFITPSLAAQVTTLSLGSDVVADGLSDHAPLVLDLALDSSKTPHVWDEEAFAREIGRRHGPAAKSVVDRLVAWADQEERELANLTGVATKVLTRFPTIAVTAEPELWFPIDLELMPKAVQSTISIRANGTVTILLGRMLAPFDQPGGREQLRAAFNGIPGVSLVPNMLYPRVEINNLADPAVLTAFVAVLSRIARETRP